MKSAQYGSPEREAAAVLIQLALREDLGTAGDITSHSIIPHEYNGSASFVARVEGVIAGLPVVEQVCRAVNPALSLEVGIQDGTAVSAGASIAKLKGPLQALLAAERTALNFIQHLSGIATLTRKYVEQVKGTKSQVLDTRKTTPGWRMLEKYAVRCGGGVNHRMGLHDAVMIKDNHLAGLREHGTPIAEAIRRARSQTLPSTILEIEVDNLQDMAEALSANPDIILLDNMPVSMLSDAIRLRDAQHSHVLLEASGGINLQTIRAVAQTGVDRISVGALTHSAPALDIALDYAE